MKKEKNLTEGNLWKGIFLFSIPLIASNILQVLFNISDIAVVGNFSTMKEKALGSVGSTAILVTLFTGFLIGIGSGVNVVIANLVGRRDDKGERNAIFTSFFCSLIIGIILLIIILIGARFFLILIDTKVGLLDGAVLYLRIYALGMPALAIYNFGNGTFSAIGNTKKPLLFLFIAGIFNVGLNLFFVIVCKLDVAGVAIASIISQYISAILIVISLTRLKNEHQLVFKGNKFNHIQAKQLLKLGVPSGFQNCIFAIANLFIQKGVNSFDELMVEGNSAATNFDALVYDVMAAFYMACSSFIGQNYGAKKKKRIIQTYFISMLYAFLAGAIIGICMYFFGSTMLRIFTQDANVVKAGMRRMKVLGLSYMISAAMDNSIAASRGIGKSVIPTIIVICGSCLFRILWVYTIFAHYHTIESLYLLYSFSWTITGVCELTYFLDQYKKLYKKGDMALA